MEIEEKVLFSIYERSVIKKKFCTISNIVKKMSMQPEFKSANKEEMKRDEIKQTILKVIGDLMDKDLLVITINESATQKDSKICFRISNSKHLQVKNAYRESIHERINQLDDNAKYVINYMFRHKVETREPFIISQLDDELQSRFEASRELLEKTGFIYVKDRYIKDFVPIDCTNAILTTAGDIAYNTMSTTKNLESNNQEM